MTNQVKIKWGLGILMVGISVFTVNYLMKQIRLLVNTVFEFSGITVNRISTKEINLTLWWKVVNKSDIAFTISNQVFDVYLDGVFIKKVGNAIPTEIRAKATARIPTYIVFTPKELLKLGVSNFGSLISKETRDKLKLKVVGNITVQTSVFRVKDFPITYEDKLGNMF